MSAEKERQNHTPPIPSLSARLGAAAGFVRPGSRLLDVGTDHGYLPAWLVSRGICPSAIAADIRPGPLSRAMETVNRYRLADQITLCLSDGLDAISPQAAEDIVIAGMGGELICSILSRAAWLRDPKIRLILQPMTHAETVRRYLFENGFSTVGECAVQDGRHLYCVLAASYSGEAPLAGQKGDDLSFLIGTLSEGRDEAARAYVRHVYEKAAAAARGLQKAREGAGEKERLKALLPGLEAVMRSWTE